MEHTTKCNDNTDDNHLHILFDDGELTDSSSIPSKKSSLEVQSINTTEVEGRGFTPFVAVCFTLNNIIGTGFLLLPWAFVQAGIALSVITLTLSTFIADLCVVYELETMARAEAMLDKEGDDFSAMIDHITTSTTFIEDVKLSITEEQNGPPETFKTSQNDYDHTANERTALVNGGGYYSIFPSQNTSTTATEDRPLLLKHRKFAMNSLCEVYLGKFGLVLYTLCASFYLYLINWVYASVFGLAVARVAPLPFTDTESASYKIYILIFAAIVVPLSMKDLEDQMLVQVSLTACRFLRLAIMICTSALLSAAYFGYGNSDYSAKDEVGGSFFPLPESASEYQIAAAAEVADTIPMFRWDGFFKMLPVTLVAACCHMSIPDLSHPVSNKSKVGCVFHWAMAIVGVMYAAI
eukprot:15347405-Ditylum_brightwellii.AAC.1